jgi:hypothetical protein
MQTSITILAAALTLAFMEFGVGTLQAMRVSLLLASAAAIDACV